MCSDVQELQSLSDRNLAALLCCLLKCSAYDRPPAGLSREQLAPPLELAIDQNRPCARLRGLTAVSKYFVMENAVKDHVVQHHYRVLKRQHARGKTISQIFHDVRQCSQSSQQYVSICAVRHRAPCSHDNHG